MESARVQGRSIIELLVLLGLPSTTGDLSPFLIREI
jgi:hypothetical protein